MAGTYDLTDQPTFDNEVTINGASFASTVPSGGNLLGTGPWTLANDVSLAAGVSHLYTLTVNVSLDLSAGSPGDNTYTRCGSAEPGTPQANEGPLQPVVVGFTMMGRPTKSVKPAVICPISHIPSSLSVRQRQVMAGMWSIASS